MNATEPVFCRAPGQPLTHDRLLLYRHGLHHHFPYAGGLGFLAGDHLKEASDPGLPMVAIGFLSQGYLHQKIDHNGGRWINEPLDFDAAPITRVLIHPVNTW